MSRFVSVLLACVLLASPAWGDEAEATAEVTKLLQAFENIATTFEQSVQGPYGELIEYSSGQFFLERPKFRWEVNEPYPQIIVSNGERLQIYDPDLEQVTERALTEALSGTPLGLLAGDNVDLAQTFIVQREDDQFVLTARDPDSAYQRIYLWTDAGALSRIEVIDQFEQTLKVVFTNDLLGATPEKPFELELPEHVEVVQG